jgi:hypothetical protein
MPIHRRALALAVLPFLVACGQIDRLKEKVESSSAQENAKTRVDGILLGVQKGGADTSIDVQKSICLWYNGKILLDMGTLSRASDLFLVWQNEGNIARRISAYSITGASDLEDGAVAVSGTIEGQPFQMKVPPGAPVSWISAPGAGASHPESSALADTNLPAPTPTRVPPRDPATLGTLRLRCSYLPNAVVTLSLDGTEVFRREMHASKTGASTPLDERIAVTPGLHSLVFSITSADGSQLAERTAPLNISEGQIKTLSASPEGSGFSIGLN